MKILLTGSTGQLGQEIIKTKPSNIDLITPNRTELDLKDYEQCVKIVHDKKPDWVINCAAYTSVDKAESELKLATKINSYAPEAFTKAINSLDSNLLHISTDFVFNGEQNIPYVESEIKSPISKYGYTKALGEELITNSIKNQDNATILRTSWVISSRGKNFALTMLKLHSFKDYINVVSDQIGVPTNAKDLAKACWKVIALKKIKKLPFILHWTDSGVASWYDLAYAVGEIGLELGILKKTAEINPIKTIEYPTPAKRPKYSILDNVNTSKLIEMNPKHWRKNLKNLLIEFKNDQN